MATRKDHPTTEQAQQCRKCNRWTLQYHSAGNYWSCQSCGYCSLYEEPDNRGGVNILGCIAAAVACITMFIAMAALGGWLEALGTAVGAR